MAVLTSSCPPAAREGGQMQLQEKCSSAQAPAPSLSLPVLLFLTPESFIIPIIAGRLQKGLRAARRGLEPRRGRTQSAGEVRRGAENATAAAAPVAFQGCHLYF